MAIGIVAIVVGLFLIVRAQWIATEGRKSRLNDVFFLRVIWTTSTSIWWVRFVGLGFIAIGVLGFVAG